MATYKAIKDPGVYWLDEAYGAPAPWTDIGAYGNISAPTDWGFLPQLAAQLGWSMPDYSSGIQASAPNYEAQTQDANSRAVSDAAQWLQSQGLTPKSGALGSTYYNGVFDNGGNLVASQGHDTGASARGDLLGMAKWLGLPAAAVPALTATLGKIGR